MKKELKYKIGDKVNYVLAGKVMFTGTITAIHSDKKLKPYVITTDKGITQYANEQYLQLK